MATLEDLHLLPVFTTCLQYTFKQTINIAFCCMLTLRSFMF